MDEFLKRLVPVVSADTIAQPTFGTLNITSTDTESGTRVDLESDQNSVKIGDNITVKVFIQTGPDVSISEFRLVIEFDQNILSVVDQDLGTLGTQIKSTNPNFVVQDPSTDNLASLGRARLIASLSGGGDTSLSAKTEVAEIAFNAQSIANTSVKISTGSTGTQLKTSAGRLIGFTTSEKQISVVDEVIVTTTPSVTTTVTSTPLVTPTLSTIPTLGVSTIPETAINFNGDFLVTLLAGSIILIIGVTLIPRNKGRKEQPDY